jgi:hypothetical protein
MSRWGAQAIPAGLFWLRQFLACTCISVVASCGLDSIPGTKRDQLSIIMGDTLAILPVTRGLWLFPLSSASDGSITFNGNPMIDSRALREVDTALGEDDHLAVSSFWYAIRGSCKGPVALEALCVVGPWRDGPKLSFSSVVVEPRARPFDHTPPKPDRVDRVEGELTFLVGDGVYFSLGSGVEDGQVYCMAPINEARACKASLWMHEGISLEIHMTMPNLVEVSATRSLTAHVEDFVRSLLISAPAAR